MFPDHRVRHVGAQIGVDGEAAARRGTRPLGALYPVTLFRLAMGAIEDGLRTLAAEGTQQSLLPRMQTRSRLYEVLGYEDYGAFDSTVSDFTLPPGN